MLAFKKSSKPFPACPQRNWLFFAIGFRSLMHNCGMSNLNGMQQPASWINWSVRVGLQYRAIAVEVEEGLLWFWIGTHADYDDLIG